MQLTSVFLAHIYILDGVKNFRSEDVNTTVYQITNLYSMRNRTINMKQRKARVKFYKKSKIYSLLVMHTKVSGFSV